MTAEFSLLGQEFIALNGGKQLGNPDPEKAAYAMQAMMGMNKFVISELY
jgi:predicted 3-demethylubiquinone-9 3-methyltransferase (glyoxalase superfamily)